MQIISQHVSESYHNSIPGGMQEVFKKFFRFSKILFDNGVFCAMIGGREAITHRTYIFDGGYLSWTSKRSKKQLRAIRRI
jgi:hypothetical protein